MTPVRFINQSMQPLIVILISLLLSGCATFISEDRLKAEIHDQTMDLQYRIEDLETITDKIEPSIYDLESDVAEIKKSLNTLKSDVGQIQESVSTLQFSVISLLKQRY